MQITDTITNIDLSTLNERVEEFGRTAVDTYSDNSGRVIDLVVDTNKKVVDVVVANAEKVTSAVDGRFEAPFADRIPTPAEAGKAYLDVVERVADFNRDLNRRVVEMVPAAPVAPKAPKARTAKK